MPQRLSKFFARAGVTTALLILGVAASPGEARAASKVCAPDGRGCSYSRLNCSQMDLPPRWTCTKYGKIVRRQNSDAVYRAKDGRAIVTVGGERLFVLSDALEQQLGGSRRKPEEFARLVLSDRGTVSEESLKKVSAELGVPVSKQAPR